MAEDTGQERTEQATERRRQESRKKGQVARSIEVNSALMLMAGFGVLMVFGRRLLSDLKNIMAFFFNLSSSYSFTLPDTRNLFLNVMWNYFSILLPVFIVMTIAGILVNIIQVGFLVTGEPLKPKLEKIDPVQGMKRLFSIKSLETLLRNILKLVIIGWIGYYSVKGILDNVMNMTGASAVQIVSFTSASVMKIAMKILIGYIVLAIFDYIFQRWDYEKSIMMTRQEIKEEMKHMEGDPLLRARIRSVQRQMARRRMLEEVPEAEVVITNPTEFAVALSYEPGMFSPVVVAKGRNMIAEKIRKIAEDSGVPIVENVYLAQALYKAVEIGNHIPEELFTAVAEVLAYVYKLKDKKVV